MAAARPSPALQVMAEEIATVSADQPGPGGGRLIDDPAFARKLADARIRTEVLEILEYRVLAAVAGGQESRCGVVDAQGARDRAESGADRAGDGGRRTARAGVPTARDVPGRAGGRVRAAAGRLRQRRAVAGGRTIALLQRQGRLDLRRQQRNSAQHSRQRRLWGCRWTSI